jgi:hypothetical protein
VNKLVTRIYMIFQIIFSTRSPKTEGIGFDQNWSDKSAKPINLLEFHLVYQSDSNFLSFLILYQFLTDFLNF